jgi:hypothetical protein
MAVYTIIAIFQVRKSVANCDRWPTYKGGQLHRFYCNKIRQGDVTSLNENQRMHKIINRAGCIYTARYVCDSSMNAP